MHTLGVNHTVFCSSHSFTGQYREFRRHSCVSYCSGCWDNSESSGAKGSDMLLIRGCVLFYSHYIGIGSIELEVLLPRAKLSTVEHRDKVSVVVE
jgi:hypothetical protein